MNAITLSLSAAEALFAYGELEKAAATAYTRWRRLIVTNAPADEQDAAKVAAEHLDRVATRIAKGLYPTHCDRGHELCTDSCGNCPTCFMHEKECTFWATFDPYEARVQRRLNDPVRRHILEQEIELGLM